MKTKNDYLAVTAIILMCITSIVGIASLNFSHSYDIVNQYGHTVSIYGYGVYANDTYFKAPIYIGTDFSVLFVMVPMFIYILMKYRKTNDKISELKLISIYAAALYYAASISFGIAYNYLFLVYVGLFSVTLFGMFKHISHIQIQGTIKMTNGLRIFLILSGLALLLAWMPDIIPTLFDGSTLSLIGIYTTEITYVLDMGIISPLCFICLYLIHKGNSIGTIILAFLLRICMIVGIMMLTQTICQISTGVEIPIPALLTKSASFLLLGGFAAYFQNKMYKELVK